MINIHLQVLAWSLVTAVSRRQLPGREEASLGQVTPRYTWTGHALPVTGIHVGHGPAHSARVVSASLDMTVKIYSMTTGKEMFHNLHCTYMQQSHHSIYMAHSKGSQGSYRKNQQMFSFSVG